MNGLTRGSSLYYSLLSLDPARQQALQALYTLLHELGDIATSRDPTVARARLDWWRQEIDRLHNGQPQHPTTQALYPALTAYGLQAEYFQNMLESVVLDLHYDAYPSFGELAQYAHARGSAPTLLAAGILGFTDRATVRFARDLGVALLLLHLLRTVRPAALQGRFYLPEDELAQFQVSHADLVAGHSSAQTQALFAHQAARIRDYAERALTALPAADRHPQFSLLLLLRLRLALLDELDTAGFPLLEQRITLTPLRKLWIVWRTQWQERRVQRAS